MTTTTNPLKQFYRVSKCTVSLPSNGQGFYPDDMFEGVDTEVDILPMTGKDEMNLKNPDALISGKALLEVISSCVPSIKKPELLLQNDIDAIVVGIKIASFGDKLPLTTNCPECGHENHYKVDLEAVISTIDKLDGEFPVNLDDGLTVYVKPLDFMSGMKVLKTQFEQQNLINSLENANLSEADRMVKFSDSVRAMGDLTIDLLLDSIVKVVQSEHNIEVSDRNQIQEYLNQLSSSQFKLLEDKSKEINAIGVRKTYSAVCDNKECGHQWEASVDYNPVNFSTGS